MKIKKQLQVELSRFNTNYIANAVGTDPQHFSTLMNYILTEKDPVPPRAAWVAEIVSEKKPCLLIPWTGKLIEGLESFTHPGTTRNVLKMLMRVEIPEEYQGLLIDICFRWIADENVKVASKIFSMQIIENHVNQYPELAFELSELIRDQFNKNSAGFKSRGKKVLKNLQKYL